MNRKPGGVLRFRGSTDRREFSRVRIIAKCVDALTRGLGGVGAHEREVIFLCTWFVADFRWKPHRGSRRQHKQEHKRSSRDFHRHMDSNILAGSSSRPGRRGFAFSETKADSQAKHGTDASSELPRGRGRRSYYWRGPGDKGGVSIRNNERAQFHSKDHILLPWCRTEIVLKSSSCIEGGEGIAAK